MLFRTRPFTRPQKIKVESKELSKSRVPKAQGLPLTYCLKYDCIPIITKARKDTLPFWLDYF